MRHVPFLLAFAALVCFGTASALVADRPEAKAAAGKSQPVAFVNVRLVPMDRERIVEGQTVLVRDGRVAEVGADLL
jgi:imidazolonepropionase-like amidohydrolase